MTKKVKTLSKKKFFDYRLLFSFKGRINRLKLLEGLFTIWGIILIIGIVLAAFLPKVWSPSLEEEELITAIYKGLGTLFIAFSILSLYTKRSHDLNWSGWSILFLFVPIANLVYLFYLFFVSGSVGDNRFGSDPLYRKNFSNKTDELSCTICSSCGAKCDNFAYDCPNCGEKFWQSRKDYEKFLDSKKSLK